MRLRRSQFSETSSFGMLIREKRKARGMKQSDLARVLTAAGCPTVQSEISRLERGKRSPKRKERDALWESLSGKDEEKDAFINTNETPLERLTLYYITLLPVVWHMVDEYDVDLFVDPNERLIARHEREKTNHIVGSIRGERILIKAASENGRPQNMLGFLKELSDSLPE